MIIKLRTEKGGGGQGRRGGAGVDRIGSGTTLWCQVSGHYRSLLKEVKVGSSTFGSYCNRNTGNFGCPPSRRPPLSLASGLHHPPPPIGSCRSCPTAPAARAPATSPRHRRAPPPARGRRARPVIIARPGGGRTQALPHSLTDVPPAHSDAARSLLGGAETRGPAASAAGTPGRPDAPAARGSRGTSGCMGRLSHC